MGADKEKRPESPVPREGNSVEFPRENLFILLTIIAIGIGIALGIGLRYIPGWEYYQKRKIFYLRFPGDLFLNAQKMLILPLIVSSVISSLATLKGKTSGKMGLRALVCYSTTSLCAMMLGIALVMSIRPGSRGQTETDRTGETTQQETLVAILDLLRNCFPENLFQACLEKQTTVIGNFSYQLQTTTFNQTTNVTDNVRNDTNKNGTIPEPVINPVVTDHPTVLTTKGSNVLGLVVFSGFFGVTISNMGDTGKPLVHVFEAIHHATMRMMMIVIWFSPLGIIFLISTKLVEMQDLETVFIQLGYYMITILVGITVHAVVVLPLVFVMVTRRNPFVFMYKMLRALLTAWVTSSSLAALPILMECLETKNKVDSRVVKFMAPIGAAINIHATGLYDAVAPIFIAQMIGVQLDVGQIITMSVSSVIAAIGTGLPSDILITSAVGLTAGGLPVDNIGVVIAVDWLLDRFVTPVNVLANGFGVGIIEHLSKNDLEEAFEHKNIEAEAEGFSTKTIYVTEAGDIVEGHRNSTFTTPL